MIRWKYVIPRAIIVILMICFFGFGTSPIIKWTLIQSGQQVTGARVDIRDVNIQWAEGKLSVRDIEFADPRNPMENLVQYEHAELDVDPGRLLHKELIIDRAKIDKVQFGTPRAKSGKLNDRSIEWPAGTGWIAEKLGQTTSRAGKRWLDQFQGRAIEQLENELETVQVSNQIHDQWTTRYKAYEQQANQINQQIRNLKQTIKEPRENPLRELERFQIAASQINQLQKDSSRIRRELRQLDDWLKRDHQRLKTAKQNDEARIRQKAKYLTVDPQTTSELLLGEEQARYVRDVLDWLDWFQDTLPNPEEDFYPTRDRGEDIQFVGLVERPRFLLKESSINGRGRIGGKLYEWSGVAKNLSSHPKAWGQPTTFEIIASGEEHLEIFASIDRREEIPKDEIRIQIPGIRTPAQQLGSPGSMMVNVAPAKLSAGIELQTIGDEIRGRIVIRHHDLAMSIGQMNSKAGNQELARHLNRHLATVDEFQVVIDLAGDRKNVQTKLQSDLGDKVAAAFGQMVNQAIDQTIATQTRQLERRLNQEYQKLANRHQQEVQKILGKLDVESQTVAEIRDLINPAKNLLKQIR